MSTIKKMVFVVVLGLFLQASMVSAPPTTETSKPDPQNYCQMFKDQKGRPDRSNCEALHRCFDRSKSDLEAKNIDSLYSCAKGVLKPDTSILQYGPRWRESPMQRFVSLMADCLPNWPGKFVEQCPFTELLTKDLGCEMEITDPEPVLYQRLSQNPPLESTFQKLLEQLLKLYGKVDRKETTLGDRCFWRFLGAGQKLYYQKQYTPIEYFAVYEPRSGLTMDYLLEQTFYCRQFSVCVEEFQASTSSEGSSRTAAANEFFICTLRTFTTANPVRQQQRLSTRPLVEPEKTNLEVVVDGAKSLAISAFCHFVAGACD